MDMLLVQEDINRIVNRNRTFFRNKTSFHDTMQDDVVHLASKYGLKGIRNYQVKSPAGYIDVVWVDGRGHIVLAVEIDSSLRSKSIEKLAHLPGDVERLWLCYSPKEIYVEGYEQVINGPVMKYELTF